MSEPLFNYLKALAVCLERAQRLLLFLDFDGTLSPIARDPAQAHLPHDTRAVLERLGRDPRVTIAIISGRALDDVRARVGLNVIYAGNHGLEIEGPGFELREPCAEALREALRALCESLTRKLQSIPGALVEYKRLTAAVHFRQVPIRRRAEVEAIVDAALESCRHLFIRRSGKMVYELRPGVHWNKGSAVRWIRRKIGRSGVLPICVGDDLTDEDAFAALSGGITVCVGTGPSLARYSVGSTAEVREFLRWLAACVQTPVQVESRAD